VEEEEKQRKKKTKIIFVSKWKSTNALGGLEEWSEKRKRPSADDIECVWRKIKKEAKRKEATNMRKLTEW
jgi:hypothetical protein